MKMRLMVILITLLTPLSFFGFLSPVKEQVVTPVNIVTETTPTVIKEKPVIKEESITKEEPVIKENPKPKTEAKVKKEKKKTENKNAPSDVSAQIWKELKDKGFSDCVCAGILGNMMREVGGDSFILDWDNNTGCGFGLCQWTSGRRKAIKARYKNPNVKQQIQFLYDELTGNNARRQVTSAQYKELINSNSPEQAALLFAKYFERCGSGGYHKRQNNARRAYNKFSGNS